jgi:hypothetical protein
MLASCASNAAFSWAFNFRYVSINPEINCTCAGFNPSRDSNCKNF